MHGSLLFGPAYDDRMLRHGTGRVQQTLSSGGTFEVVEQVSLSLPMPAARSDRKCFDCFGRLAAPAPRRFRPDVPPAGTARACGSAVSPVRSVYTHSSAGVTHATMKTPARRADA